MHSWTPESVTGKEPHKSMKRTRIGFFNKQRQFEQDMLERGVEYEYSSFYADSLKQLKKNKMAMGCAVILLLLILIAIFAPLLAPYDPAYQDYTAVLAEPSSAHLLGTDESSTAPVYPSASASSPRSSPLS